MEFFFDDAPSTSQPTPKKPLEDSQLTQDADGSSTALMSSSVNMTDIQQQRSSSTVDDIGRRVQDLIETINHRRSNDQEVIDSFQEKLIDKLTAMCQQMKERLYMVYEENSNEIQVKLQTLSEVLESCTKLNNELTEATEALAGLREGLRS